MFDKIKSLLGMGNEVNYEELMKNGAVIVDVRSNGEFAGGHIKQSINIPLQSLESNLSGLDKNKPVITCCASGMRSASAKNILIANGFTEVVNGGGWSSLESKI